MDDEAFILVATIGWLTVWWGFNVTSMRGAGVIVALLTTIFIIDIYRLFPTVMTPEYGVTHGELILIALAGVPYFLLFLRVLIRRRRTRTGRRSFSR